MECIEVEAGMQRDFDGYYFFIYRRIIMRRQFVFPFKYHGPTNRLGGRVSVSYMGSKVIMSYDYSVDRPITQVMNLIQEKLGGVAAPSMCGGYVVWTTDAASIDWAALFGKKFGTKVYSRP